MENPGLKYDPAQVNGSDPAQVDELYDRFKKSLNPEQLEMFLALERCMYLETATPETSEDGP